MQPDAEARLELLHRVHDHAVLCERAGLPDELIEIGLDLIRLRLANARQLVVDRRLKGIAPRGPAKHTNDDTGDQRNNDQYKTDA